MSDQLANRQRPKPPFHPFVVLGIAVVLPGVGQVINNQPNRGLLFLFTMIALGYVTYHLSTPEISLVGRYAGGLFMYALSLMDAYKWARVRWVIFHQPAPPQNAADLQKAQEKRVREAGQS